MKQTRSTTKQDFSGEALQKQNTEASLASLSYNSSRAATEWSAIFAFGVLDNPRILITTTTLFHPSVTISLEHCLTLWNFLRKKRGLKMKTKLN